MFEADHSRRREPVPSRLARQPEAAGPSYCPVTSMRCARGHDREALARAEPCGICPLRGIWANLVPRHDIDEGMGHADSRSADAGDALEHAEDLGEREVLASQEDR